jgi:hypothetical protein
MQTQLGYFMCGLVRDIYYTAGSTAALLTYRYVQQQQQQQQQQHQK